MPTAALKVLLLVLVAAACGPTSEDALRASLAQRIAAVDGAVEGAEVGIWFEDLASGVTVAVDDTVTFHAASTMKVPVMMALFDRAAGGALALDDSIRLQNRFKSIVDGSAYTLSPAEDSDSALYHRVGQAIAYRELIERMIVRSSNLATNALIEHLDPVAITDYATRLGGEGVRVLRGVEDGLAFRAGLNNTTTARGMGRLLAALERGAVGSDAATDEMRAILMRQEFNEEIPAGLPAGTPVAHKTGWIIGTTHDAAVVYPPSRPPYVLVILTRGIPDREVAQRLMADLSRLVWEYATAPGHEDRAPSPN